MPFIDSKVTVSMTEEKKENIKKELGQAVNVLGKGESFLMVGFEDKYDLYLGGEKLDKGAFVSVRLYGSINSASSNKMTAEVCRIMEEQLGIPGDNVYVAYQGIADWGWNGRNF